MRCSVRAERQVSFGAGAYCFAPGGIANGEVFTLGAPPALGIAGPSDRGSVMLSHMPDPMQHDHFVLRQRIKLVINQYEFSVPDANGDGEPFCFVEQKRFKFKEDIRFFTDESKQQELLKILARQRFDPAARYDVTLPDGTTVGQIQKAFGSSLLRSTYILYAAAGHEVARVRERSLGVALFRRLVGFVPYVGNFADWLPIPYDFEFLHGEQRLGLHRRRRGKWRDIYDLDLSSDTERTIDRRLALATAVGMDALQAR